MSALIEVHELAKSYGRKKALNNVSFSIAQGSPVALVGPNGAGKSTLFSLLCGYINPDAGSVRILGEVPGSQELAGKVGALPQDALLNPDQSVGQQLRFFAELQGFHKQEAIAEARRVLAIMGLEQQFDERPNALSHGMKKRVSIAQALIGSPKLVFLDEPTAGLDPENARNIRQQLTKLSNQTTFVISSHNLEELERLCDQVLYLERGEIKLQQSIGQASQDAEKDKEGILALRLASSNDGVQKLIGQLDGVEKVHAKQSDEYIIHYNRSNNSMLDVQLLQMLHEKKIAYRQLVFGQSLEDQLYSS